MKAVMKDKAKSNYLTLNEHTPFNIHFVAKADMYKYVKIKTVAKISR